jgi:hypothetical protein
MGLTGHGQGEPRYADRQRQRQRHDSHMRLTIRGGHPVIVHRTLLACAAVGRLIAWLLVERLLPATMLTVDVDQARTSV